MYSTNLDGVANSGLVGSGCDHQATQPALASDTNRFAQLMSQNPQGIQGSHPPPGNAEAMSSIGDRPPPPPPPQSAGSTNSSSRQSSACEGGTNIQGTHPPPPPPPQGVGDANELSELSSSESFANIISQLMIALQPMDFSNVYDFDSSSDLLSGSFGDYSSESYLNGSFG